ncbi:MAG TPA: hypothetical protein VFU90_04065, partial [Candidatus Tumulicola sp.]|nr:hypothetical protein [Candidatus Tumulicola sp.]
GYAVYLKAAASSAGGANWYWYEQLPPATAQSFGLEYTSTGVVADGFGGAGQPQTVCVGCHGAAGSDAPHTPSAGGGDEVYTPVH